MWQHSYGRSVPCKEIKRVFLLWHHCVFVAEWRGTAGLGNEDDVKHKDDLVGWVLTSDWKTRDKNKFG